MRLPSRVGIRHGQGIKVAYTLHPRKGAQPLAACGAQSRRPLLIITEGGGWAQDISCNQIPAGRSLGQTLLLLAVIARDGLFGPIQVVAGCGQARALPRAKLGAGPSVFASSPGRTST